MGEFGGLAVEVVVEFHFLSSLVQHKRESVHGYNKEVGDRGSPCLSRGCLWSSHSQIHCSRQWSSLYKHKPWAMIALAEEAWREENKKDHDKVSKSLAISTLMVILLNWLFLCYPWTSSHASEVFSTSNLPFTKAVWLGTISSNKMGFNLLTRSLEITLYIVFRHAIGR